MSLRLKLYQGVILVFALGIFVATYIGIYFIKSRDQLIDDTASLPSNYSSINAFFSNSVFDPNSSDCNITYPTSRSMNRMTNNSKSVLAEFVYLALKELLSGPTDSEKSAGYFTSINQGVGIKKIIIENGTASVDFNEQLGIGVAGSCRVSAIRSQIENTLKQFSEITQVVIMINGESEAILQP